MKKEIGINVFKTLTNKGIEGLRNSLNELDIKQLRLIVRHHCFDPTGLVYRWKNKERLINHICERTYSRSTKGDVFRKY